MPQTRRSKHLSGLVLLILAFLLSSNAGARADSNHLYTFNPAYGTQVQSIATLDEEVLQNFMTELPAGRYFEAGQWHSPTSEPHCWWCLDGAGTAAAILSQRTPKGDHMLVSVAEATFNRTLAEELLPDGAFQSDGVPSEIVTGCVLVELGITYLELKESLATATRANWLKVIEANADYLMTSGALTWYINGNDQLHQVEDMWLAWKITGAKRFEQAYEWEWNFTIEPPQARWPGFGLHITRTPLRPDGSDGSGYLAESGGGAPGFDPEYTTLQLDNATSLWVLTHEERYLRLVNLLLNQLLPLVNAEGILDARGGTRKNNILPFFSMAPQLLLSAGDRPELAQSVATQLAVVAREYHNRNIYENLNFYRGLSIWLSMPLLFEQWPDGIMTGSSVKQAPTSRGTSHKSPAPRARSHPRRHRPSRSQRSRRSSRGIAWLAPRSTSHSRR